MDHEGSSLDWREERECKLGHFINLDIERAQMADMTSSYETEADCVMCRIAVVPDLHMGLQEPVPSVA